MSADSAAEIAALRAQVEALRSKLEQHGIAADDEGSPPSPSIQQQQQNPGTQSHPTSVESCGHGLKPEQVARYSRQIILPCFGAEAQGRLQRGSVLVIGAGGLGSPAALYLAAAGVGRLGIVDRDTVDKSNLHRQIIHAEASQGRCKAESAAAACRRLNSGICVVAHAQGFTQANAVGLVQSYDVIVDATDNAPSRYLIRHV